MKPCPYCAEEIQDAAVKCRFCGEFLAHEFKTDSGNVAEQGSPAQASPGASTAHQSAEVVFHDLRPTSAYDHRDPSPAVGGQGSAGNVVAAIGSIIIPGLGQLAQGRMGAAIAHFVAACLVWFFSVGLLGWVAHLLSAAEAAQWSPTRAGGESGCYKLTAVSGGLGCAIVSVLIVAGTVLLPNRVAVKPASPVTPSTGTYDQGYTEGLQDGRSAYDAAGLTERLARTQLNAIVSAAVEKSRNAAVAVHGEAWARGWAQGLQDGASARQVERFGR